MCDNGQRQTNEWRNQAQPAPSRLPGNAEKGAKDSGKHRMAAQAKQREATAILKPPRSNLILSVGLRDIEGCLNEVEANADKRPINKPIAHVIEFGAEKRKEQEHAQRFRKFLDRWGGKRSAEQKRAMRAKVYANLWVLRQPPFDAEN
jgi:hypothetical protein